MQSNSSTYLYDTIIVGAGTSGLIVAAQLNKKLGSDHRILILDHSDKIATKLLISGGGKCNFTNKNVSHENYISSNINFTRSALARYKSIDIINRIKKARITYEEREHGQMFTTTSSKDIVEHIRSKLIGVNIMLNTAVSVIDHEHNEFSVTVCNVNNINGSNNNNCDLDQNNERDNSPNNKQSNIQNNNNDNDNCNDNDNGNDNGNHHGRNITVHTYKSRNLIIATGGVSYPQVGATDLGYSVAKQFGHALTPVRPGLTPLILDQELNFTSLAGISLDVVLTIKKRQFRLPLLFTHKGISGPAALQASNYWSEGDEITIDFLPNIKVSINDIFNNPLNKKNTVATQLSKLLPARLVKYLIPETMQDHWCCSIPKKNREEILNLVHNFTTIPTATEGLDKAEISIGGVALTQIDSKSMQSKLVKGLYFIGEVLDVSGQLGGYNLHWAYASAMAAADNIDTDL